MNVAGPEHHRRDDYKQSSGNHCRTSEVIVLKPIFQTSKSSAIAMIVVRNVVEVAVNETSDTAASLSELVWRHREHKRTRVHI